MPCPYLYLPPNLAPDSLPDVKNVLLVEAELGFIYLFLKCYLLGGEHKQWGEGFSPLSRKQGMELLPRILESNHDLS